MATANWVSFGGTRMRESPLERERPLCATAARQLEERSEPHPVIVPTRNVGVNTSITAVRTEMKLALSSSIGTNTTRALEEDLEARSRDNADPTNRDPSSQQTRSCAPRDNYDHGRRIDLASRGPSEFPEEVLARVLTVGYEFDLLSDAQVTWNTAMRMVAASLRRAGYHTPVTVENKKQRKDGERNWHYGSLVCTCSGKPRQRPRHDNPNKRRKTRSAKCGCTFGVSIAWPRRKNPYVTQVNLTHSNECSAEAKLKRLRARLAREARKGGSEDLGVFDAQATCGGGCISDEDGGEECLVDVGGEECLVDVGDG